MSGARPPGALRLGPSDRKVLVRLIEGRRSGRRATMRSLAGELDMPMSTVRDALYRMQDEGLVATQPKGALRALVDVVPV